MAKCPVTFAQQLQQVSQNDPDLVVLSLEGCDLDIDDITLLTHALARNNYITTLNLSRNNIGDEGTTVLAKALANNNTITTLNLLYAKIRRCWRNSTGQ